MIALSHPPLVLTRPRWLDTLASFAHLKKGASGHLLKTSTGHLALSEICCQSGSSVTATFTGVTPCGCRASGVPGFWERFVDSNINSSFAIPFFNQVGDICTFNDAGSESLEYRRETFGDSSCSGSGGGQDLSDNIVVQYNASTQKVTYVEIGFSNNNVFFYSDATGVSLGQSALNSINDCTNNKNKHGGGSVIVTA